MKHDSPSQTLYFNLALLAEARAAKDPNRKSVCQAGVLEIRKALDTGPQRADLYYHGAILYTLASAWDDALAYLEQAIKLGLQPSLLDNAVFEPLKELSRYKRLKTFPSQKFDPEPTPNLVDPIRE
jgi:hypothetical protein